MSGSSNLIDEVNKWFKATLAGRTEEAAQIRARHFAEEEAHVNVEISPLSVTYKIEGHSGPVSDIVQMIFDKYPAPGYGTRIVSRSRACLNHVDTDEIVVKRYLSCE